MTEEKGRFFVQWILPINPIDNEEFEIFFGYDKKLMEIKGANTAEEASEIVDEILASKPIDERPVGYDIFEKVSTRLNISPENKSK